MEHSIKPINSILMALIIGVIIAISAAWFWPRTEALDSALQPFLTQGNSEQPSVADAILNNYHETRRSAKNWSAVYWGFTFMAAILSALAGLILKVESIFQNKEKMRKDVAAVFSVTAALLITISTSGDFQRKWQANRVAASELEKAGYDFLENGETNPRHYYSVISSILNKRNLAIVGDLERNEHQ